LPLDLGDALVFVGFGLAATLVGGLVPANHTGELALYQRLRTGTEEAGLQFANRAHWLGLALLVLAAISVWIPPYGNIPLGGYLSIAFGLFGGVAMIGLVVRTLIRPPKRLRSLSGLARTRLASTPNLLSIGLSGIVASFALVVGMHIMVHSFRQSLDEWLNQVLPAPLYLDLKAPGQPSFPQSIQERISQIQGLEHVEFWGQQDLLLDPMRPAVSFISRPIVPSEANERLPLIGEFVGSPREGELPIWVSEPMVDLYNYKTGESVDLVLDGGRRIRATVMGVWRDYSRQHGAIVTSKIALKSLLNMQIADTQGAVWPEGNVTVAELTRRIASAARQAGLQVPIDFSQPGDIRERSMAIFDRSFAVTYVLEFAAVLIGLFGVATTFSAMALQRKREFALLGALGAGPKAMRRMLTQEALLASLLAAAIGLLIGLAFAAVLIFVVNPQSFYWTMEWHTPWRDLTIMLFALVSLSTITVTLAPHAQLKDDLLNPLKEDWA
jgi:putative ABC transport system permease protein